MAVIQRVVKATTRKGKRILLKKQPQVTEGPKRCLFLQGRKSSETLRALSNDLYDFAKPNAVKLSRKNDITIFEDPTPMETFCKKFETPLFVLGSHSKKRPHNLVIGRMFNYNVLDMIEMHVNEYKGLKEFATSKIGLGIKPCLIFNGPNWEDNDELKHLKSLLIDLFHREEVDCIRLQGLEHAISVTLTPEKKILIRSYRVVLKKSGCQTPRVEMEEIGPRIGLTLRRSKLPSDDLMKDALRRPKELKVKTKKNISTDNLGTTHGRIHVGKQEIQKVQTRKMKGLKKTAAERKKEKMNAKLMVSNKNIVDKQKQQAG